MNAREFGLAALSCLVLGFVGCGSDGASSAAGGAGSGGQVAVGGVSGHGGGSADGGARAGAGIGGNAGERGSEEAGAAGAESGMSGAAGEKPSSNAGAAGEVAASTFAVSPPAAQTISVELGSHSPTVAFSATLQGQPVAAAWSVDRADIGTITAGPSANTVFTPSGNVGGLVTLSARLASETIQRTISVQIASVQNGLDPVNPAQSSQAPSSASALMIGGGVDGVGGEGLGPAVTDSALLAALAAPASNGATQGLKLLYPYDQTVFPRGLAAPLLSWDYSVGDADAIQIALTTQSGSFKWTGRFGRPAVLTTTGGPFIRHPIPDDIWSAATHSAGGRNDKLTVSLTVAKGSQAYGPISETWTIAPTRLPGVIYYVAYGGNLVKNATGALGGNGSYGGAVLSLHAGDSGPQVAAGSSGTTSQCRACHSVAALGSRFVAVHGDDMTTTSRYEVTPGGIAETKLATALQYPALSPDGSLALAADGTLLALPSGQPLSVTGLTSIATALATPTFSPGGQRVAFSPMASSSLSSPMQKLVVMTFDSATLTFAAAKTVADYSALGASYRPGFPSFLPDDQSLVYQRQSVAGLDGSALAALSTREGEKAQVFWTNTAGAASATLLNALNGLDAQGTSYLAKLAASANVSCFADTNQVGNLDADHADDANLNYQPSVDPIPAAGYAWVVFTSRRRYGSVATLPPFCSDARGVDLVKNVTTKKLWVAAVDLNAPAGTDRSHPAFYLPSQELLAANGRPTWAEDACRSDGSSCQSGDQCCNGYCRAAASGGATVCSAAPTGNACSAEQEHCGTSADCCDATQQCWHGMCAQTSPQ